MDTQIPSLQVNNFTALVGGKIYNHLLIIFEYPNIPIMPVPVFSYLKS